MTDTEMLKLERLIVAVESVASNLEKLITVVDAASLKGAVDNTPKSLASSESRIKKEAHFAQFAIEVCEQQNGRELFRKGNTNGGDEFVLFSAKTSDYGYISVFMKRSKVQNFDAFVSALKPGTSFVADWYMTHKSFDDTKRGRWTASFVRFVTDKTMLPQNTAKAKPVSQINDDDDDIAF